LLWNEIFNNKLVSDLTDDQFLKLHIAEEDKLLNVIIHEKIDTTRATNFLDEAK